MEVHKEKEMVKAPTHACYICDRQFSCAASQRRHIRSIHHLDTTNLCSNNRSLCPLCEFRFFRLSDLRVHLEQNHGVKIKTQFLSFSSFKDFEKWKETIETTTNSAFTKPRGDKYTRSGTRKSVYHCSRSGHYRPEGTGQRAMKTQGTRKINAVCPAAMEVTVEKKKGPSCVQVIYVDTHCGHALNELNHLDLSKSEKLAIVGQLKAGVRSEEIVEKVRGDVAVPMKRKHLLTKTDVRNIRKAFKISEPLNPSNEFMSIEMWVDEVRQSSAENCVLFFKKQNVKSDLEGLTKDDMCLIVMTDDQRQMLKQHGNSCICMDSTQNTSSSGFELTTLLGFRNHSDAFPAAFMFSNRQKTGAYKVFLNHVKMHVGELQPHTFFDEDTEHFYEAWASVMGDVPNKFWHKLCSLQEKLQLIKSVERQRNILRQIKDLQMEVDQERFSHTLVGLVDQMDSDPAFAEFGRYFKANYCNQVHLWAYCFRQDLGIGSDLGLVKIHKMFKRNYSKGMEEKRYDKPIRFLLKFIAQAKDLEKSINAETCKGKRALQAIKNRHKESLKSNDILTIRKFDDGTLVWSFQSTTISNEIYDVRLNKTCDCNLRCEECNKCVHNFSCTCPDYLIKRFMCKHMHQVCSILQSSGEEIFSEICIAAENISTCNQLNLEIIQITENTPIELDSNVMSIDDVPTDAEIHNEHVAPEKLDCLKAELDRILQMCSTTEHVRIVEEAVKTIDEKFLTLPFANGDCLNQFIDHCQ